MEKKSEFWYRNIRQLRSIEDISLDELYGDKLGYALELLGIRQVEFARMTGIAESTISKYINGARIPDTRNALTMLNVLWKVIADRGYGGRMG